MRIAIVAGFVSAVNASLTERFNSEIKERSLIVHEQRKNSEVDLAKLKADLFDQIAQGATDFLICTPENRRAVHLNYSIDSLLDGTRARYPDIVITPAVFKSVFDKYGITAKVEAFQPSREKMFSGSLNEVEEWIRTKHSSRLTLHPRASRGLRKSRYQDVPGIYAALDLLAREYRDVRLAPPDQSVMKRGQLEEKLLTLGLEITPSISESRAGQEGDDYYVEFPTGQGKKFLDQHLKKGVAHDERVCLRIYFFWHAAMELVVVGWLTSHLGTRAG